MSNLSPTHLVSNIDVTEVAICDGCELIEISDNTVPFKPSYGYSIPLVLHIMVFDVFVCCESVKMACSRH